MLATILTTLGVNALYAQEATRLDIRWSPIVDLHFYARFAATNPSSQASPDELRPLVAAVQKVNEALGADLLSWGVIEGSYYDCSTGADARAAFAKLPERFTLRPKRPGESGQEIALHVLALELGEAVAKVEGSYVATIAPKNEQLVRQSQEVVSQLLHSKESACLSYMIRHLGPDDPKAMIPVYLVADMPYPGAVTQLRPGRAGGVCFVAVRGVEPLQLVETILHEATHALDVVWPETAVLDQLRSKLQAVGPPVDRRDLRDVPHTLMFVHAGETVRRNIDADHRHYGDVSGYYAKVPRATNAVRGPWIDYLDGKTTGDEALERIVDALRTRTDSP